MARAGPRPSSTRKLNAVRRMEARGGILRNRQASVRLNWPSRGTPVHATATRRPAKACPLDGGFCYLNDVLPRREGGDPGPARPTLCQRRVRRSDAGVDHSNASGPEVAKGHRSATETMSGRRTTWRETSQGERTGRMKKVGTEPRHLGTATDGSSTLRLLLSLRTSHSVIPRCWCRRNEPFAERRDPDRRQYNRSTRDQPPLRPGSRHERRPRVACCRKGKRA